MVISQVRGSRYVGAKAIMIVEARLVPMAPSVVARHSLNTWFLFEGTAWLLYEYTTMTRTMMKAITSADRFHPIIASRGAFRTKLLFVYTLYLFRVWLGGNKEKANRFLWELIVIKSMPQNILLEMVFI